MPRTRRLRSVHSLAALALASTALALAGCQNSAQTGLVAGAGLGALMGQAIGGNTTGTLIGTAAGAGIGYIIGNERDKARAAELSRQNAASPPSSGAAFPAAGNWSDRPVHTEVAPLGGTRWLLVSVNPRDAAPPHASILVEFRDNGRVLTTTTQSNGTVESADECFRVVGETLIINRPGYLINARFQMSGNQLIVSAERFSAVLSRLPS